MLRRAPALALLALAGAAHPGVARAEPTAPVGDAAEETAVGKRGDGADDPLTEPEYGDRGGVFTPFEPRVELTGSLRGRATGVQGHHLGRAREHDPQDRFARFVPAETADLPARGCAGGCGGSRLGWADWRLRLAPTLRVSELLAIHATFDAGGGAGLASALPGGATAPFSTVLARHAWAEVNKGDRVLLRFGRQPVAFGLGLVQHPGLGLDDDAASVVDRAEVELRLSALRFSLAYDWVANVEGGLGGLGGLSGTAVPDDSDRDDAHQGSVRLVWQRSEEQRAALREGGQWSLEGGAQWLPRYQELTEELGTFRRLDASTHVLDAWMLVRRGNARWETELVHVRGTALDADARRLRATQWGGASELAVEGRVLSGGVELGFASGDAQGALGPAPFGESAGRRATAFTFHAGHRVDLILWRTILGAVEGAGYARPWVAATVTESDYGELLRFRLDAVYSRAARAAQAPGRAPDLGVELDATAEWRSQDGPELDDGFVLLGQYGVLFPLAGLGWAADDPQRPPGFAPVIAHQARVVLGVVY